MKKVYILSALLSLATCFTAKADNGKVNVLLLDGQSHEVAMSTVSKLEISGDNILVVDKSGTTVGTYKMEDIDKISLTASATGIGQVKAGAPITVRSNVCQPHRQRRCVRSLRQTRCRALPFVPLTA
mgnify:CR=1 FL=1